MEPMVMEPPVLKPKIPIIGHLIGILWHQSVYLEKLGNEIKTPIATLPMVNRIVYLVTSPALAREVFRSGNLSFEPFLIESSAWIMRSSTKTMQRLTERDNDDQLSGIEELLVAMHSGLTRNSFQKLIMASLNRILFTINGLGQVTEVESLFQWMRKTIALATSRALFGAEDPLNKDHDLVNSLGDFNDGLLSLIIGFCPRIFAPRAYRARATLQVAYGNYYLNNYDQERDVSALVRFRAKVYRDHGIDPMEIGKREISVLQVATANVIATAFWTLLFIAADPVVTQNIRTEIICAIALKAGKAGWEEATLNVARLDDLCPMLVSAYKETERMVVSQVSTRRVMEDTVISDGDTKYLLRAGADIQIPAGVSHLSKEIWGKHADKFNFRRFLKSGVTSDTARELHRKQIQSYFPFGGGKHLCPGRQYASIQILALVAPLIMAFDIRDKDGGFIQKPDIVRGRLAEAVARPSNEGMRMGARLIRRKEWEGTEWKFVQGKK